MNQMCLAGVPAPVQRPKKPAAGKVVIPYERDWHLTPEDGSIRDEDAEVVFEDGSQVVDYVAYRASTDRWVEAKESDLHAIGLSPMDAATGGCCGLYTNARGIVRQLPDIDPELPINAAAIQEERLFLVIPGEDGEPEVLPCRYTALQSVMESDGLGCKMMLIRQQTKDGVPLPPSLRASIFNLVRDYRRNEVIILVREGAVGYVGTSYAPLCPHAGLMAFLEAVQADHPDMEFLSGRASHDALVAEYDLHDELLNSQFGMALGGLGERGSASCHAAFMTSEVGRWAMTARAYVRMKRDDGTTVSFPLPYPARVDHRGRNTSIASWKEVLRSFAASFKDAIEAVEKLGTIAIEGPGKCLARLREQYTVLPSDAVKTKAAALDAEFPDGCMAVDVYAAALELVNVDGAGSVQAFLERSEESSKMMYLPWLDIDQGKPWKKPR